MIDSHCHLCDSGFDPDRDAMIQRARDAGVEAFVTIATGPEDWQRNIALAKAHTDVRVALGIHPNEASCFTVPVFAEMSDLARDNAEVVAIGETGLDFYRDHAPREIQSEAFCSQLNLAVIEELPFILHCRAAEKEMLDILETYRVKTGRPLCGVWHCFTAAKEFGLRAAEMGLHFGLGGVVTYPNANAVRETVAALPEDRLLLETDCPYLAPKAWRGKRNEPAYLTAVVQTLAAVRGVSTEAVSTTTTANAKRLFAL